MVVAAALAAEVAVDSTLEVVVALVACSEVAVDPLLVPAPTIELDKLAAAEDAADRAEESEDAVPCGTGVATDPLVLEPVADPVADPVEAHVALEGRLLTW